MNEGNNKVMKVVIKLLEPVKSGFIGSMHFIIRLIVCLTKIS